MRLRLLLLSLASVSSAASIDLQYFGDHYLDQPTNFETIHGYDNFREAVRSFGGDVTESFGENNPNKETHGFEERGLKTEFTHHDSHRISNGESSDRKTTGFSSAFSSTDLNKYNHRNIDKETRSSHGRAVGESLNRELELETQNSGREIHDRSIESKRRKNVNRHKTSGVSRREFGNSFGLNSGFSSQNFGSQSFDNHQQRVSKINRNLNSHSNKFNRFSQDNINIHSRAHDRTVQENKESKTNTEDNRKNEFEVISVEKARTQNNGNYQDSNKRHNIETLDSHYEGVQNRKNHNQQPGRADSERRIDVTNVKSTRNQNTDRNTYRTNTDHLSNIAETNKKVDSERTDISRTQNTKSGARRTQTENSGPRRTNSGVDNKANTINHRPEIKNTENEIPYNPDQNPVANRTNGHRKEEDRWIWNEEDKKRNETTTVIPDKVTLDDRAAFAGGKCPSGQIKINNTCIDVD